MENKDNKPTKNQKKTIIFVSIFASVALVLDVLICLICYYVAQGQFNKYLENNDEYTVNESTEQIHNHMMEYLKENTKKVDLSHEPRKIVALTFNDKHLNIAAEDHYTTIFYDITTVYADVNTALNAFKNSKPGVATFDITISFEINDDTKFNPNKFLSGDKVIGHATYVDGLDPRYITFTGRYSDNEIVSCIHEEYKESGLYTTVKKANASMHPLLYDFYYLILNN